MTATTALFYVFAALLLVSALRVITARNPVTAALFLVLSFFTASMIWMLLKAEFLAILLVLVYVGAVMVLFLFVVMMLDIDIAKMREGFRSHLPQGLIVGGIMAVQMIVVLANAYWNPDVQPAALPADFNNTKALGVAMYADYFLAIQVAAVILLVAMVAAIALTLRRRKDSKYQDPGEQVKVKRNQRLRVIKMPAVSDRASDSKREGA
jgi:NADH-quinone oxidoreductase subunit J